MCRNQSAPPRGLTGRPLLEVLLADAQPAASQLLALTLGAARPAWMRSTIRARSNSAIHLGRRHSASPLSACGNASTRRRRPAGSRCTILGANRHNIPLSPQRAEIPTLLNAMGGPGVRSLKGIKVVRTADAGEHFLCSPFGGSTSPKNSLSTGTPVDRARSGAWSGQSPPPPYSSSRRTNEVSC